MEKEQAKSLKKIEVEESQNNISLMDYLNNLSGEEINKLYDEKVKFDKKAKARKKEKIEQIYEMILLEVITILSIIGPKKIEAFNDVINNKQPKEVDQLILDNFLLIKTPDGYKIFDEVKEIYEHSQTKEVIDNKKQVVFSHYIEINGLLKEEKIIELMKASGFPLTEKEINQYIKENNFIKEKNIIYLNEFIKGLNENNELLELKEENEYKIFSFEEITIYLMDMLTVKHQEKINKVLRKKLKDKDRIDEISYFIMMRTTIGDDFEDDVEEMLDELDITLNDKEQKELFGILDEIYYEMPSLILNGYRPLELLEEAEEYDEDYWSFDDLTDEEKIEVYINAYLNINGTIKIDKLLKIINEEHNIKITKNKLIKAIKQIEEIKIYEDYIMGKENQKEDFEYLLSVKKLDEYYIIEDIDEMYDEIDEVESLIKEVIKNYGLSNNICDEIIALLNVNGFNEDILYCILEHHGIKMTLKKQHQLYQNIKIHTNNYRVWYLNGFKINDNKHIKKQEKIGRNSKCPCGSGKKYKQCCGK